MIILLFANLFIAKNLRDYSRMNLIFAQSNRYIFECIVRIRII